jgi:integrase/recombinase XerD
MTVLVYVRHAITCPKQDDRYWRRCDCPKWHQYQRNGKQIRETAKTRSWETAAKKAREKEHNLEFGLPLEKPTAKTVTDCVDRYLEAKKSSGLGDSAYTKQSGLLKRMDAWFQSQGVLYLKDVTADLLSDWRGKWEFKKYDDGQLSASWKVHWAIVKSFFTHAHKFGWIPTNIAAMLNGFKTASKQVQPFSKDQMTAILAAVPKCGWDAVKTRRIVALIQTMRWSGLAIQDAVCLKRSTLDEQGRIRTARTKTKTPIAVLLPPAVAESLRALPEDKPGYFFTWMSPQKSQIGSEYRKILLKVFEKAGIKDGHSHQFRHTFAVENLVAGMKLEDVSRLLGHRSTAVTEKHYSAWIPERQAKLEAAVRGAWANMELPG